MASSHKDSSPNIGARAAKGMKNEDGRENGSAYNKKDKAPFSPKHTFDPNEDASQLNGGKDRAGLQD
jgi:hypothetical protein